MKPGSAVCDLCGLPLHPPSIPLGEGDRSHRFCCIGCKQVFSMLMEASDSPDPDSFKETELFLKCRALGIIPASETELLETRHEEARQESGRWAHDEPPPPEEGLELHYKITDMWCPACSWVIEETLRKTPGILHATCNFSTDRLKCRYDPIRIQPDIITNHINELGYLSVTMETGREPIASRNELIRVVVSSFLTMNIMMFSFALYSGFFSRLSHDAIYKLSWPPFIMATFVLFYGGRRIYQKARKGIKTMAFGMETLIGVGSLSAYGYSLINLLSGSIHLYFDTASMLITLTLIGKVLERRAKDRVQASLESFFELLPTKVRLCTDRFPSGRYVDARQLQTDDKFRVMAGETVPADGLIAGGEGVVDEAMLTGEAEPIRKRIGNRIKSGTQMISGELTIKAEGVGGDSTLGQMVRIMETALSEKSELEGKTDRILQMFVPGILLLALATGLVWTIVAGSIETGMIRAVTVMVISCPCALGIAIPLARLAGISLAGKKGILVREYMAFERAADIDSLVFDKTGTVTQGEWRLQRIQAMAPYTESDILEMALGLEWESEHYIAAEIVRTAQTLGIKENRNYPLSHVTHRENGISGRLDHQEIRIGAKDFVINPIAPVALPELGQEESVVYMSIDGRLGAVFIFGDRIRQGIPEMIETLHNKGYRTALVSGDGEQTTRAIGNAIGIQETMGAKLPREKAAFVASMQKKGNIVAMVGDGINDAPALVQSDVSFAVHSGSHLGREAAQVTLMHGNPVQLLDFLLLVKRVNRKVLQNLMGALIYNVVGIPVAMFGLLSPLVAVTAMFMSSLTVTGNTLHLIRKYSKSP